MPGRDRTQGLLPEEEEGDGNPRPEAAAQPPNLGGCHRVRVDPEALWDLHHHLVSRDVPLGHEPQTLRNESRLHHSRRGRDRALFGHPLPEVRHCGLRWGEASSDASTYGCAVDPPATGGVGEGEGPGIVEWVEDAG